MAQKDADVWISARSNRLVTADMTEETNRGLSNSQCRLYGLFSKTRSDVSKFIN